MASEHHTALQTLVQTALRSPGLLPPNEFNLARYSLNPLTRNRLLDPDICALEDYLIDHSGLPDFKNDPDSAVLHTFGDVVHHICRDDSISLRVGYQYMAWLLAWLNSHHSPSFFGEDPDSPLQALQMAAALGTGEWAAAYQQIEGGLDTLFSLANSPLWRVREASALGLQRLLRHKWQPTLRRFRYQMLMANAQEWRAMLVCWQAADLLAGQSSRVLDVIELLQGALRLVAGGDDSLTDALNTAIAAMVRANPPLGFAYMQAWAAWPNPPIHAILRENLPS